MRIEAIALVALCVASFTPGSAQSTQAPPPKKGIFALAEKLSGGAQSTPKGKVPPPPPVFRASGARHPQRVVVSAYGRGYVLTNFQDVSADKQSEFEAALNSKNGFRAYSFGMSAEAFVAEANKQGERFHRAKEAMFPEKDFAYTTPAEQQIVNGVPVAITYGFYKGKLARIVLKPHESHPELTAKELLALYEAFANTYGPGEEKILVAKDWSPTPFDGCEELLREDALHKLSSTMLATQRTQGGFRPGQVGENLTFCGYFWASDKVEVNFCTSTDLSELSKSKAGVWDKNTGEKTFTVALTSKTVLGPYLAERLSAKSGSGSKGI